jgi:sn1-specific diacylglycerol lipase
LAAVTELIGDDDDAEVVYSIWRDEVFETPFYVAADHTKRAIVIAIRGSKSFNDALTDLCVDAVPVDVHGLSDCWAHKGMYHAAMYVKATLEADKVLDTWLDRYPGYRVLTVGHSLGAGVAALLALLLRPGYPNIFCYSYSPPGALMSLELATYSAEFVVTCFVGLDVVPRVSYATVEDLKVKVVRMVAASRAPKWSLIAHSFPFGCCGIYYCCGCSCCCPGDEVIDNEFLVSQEVENNITKLKTPFYQLRHIENERQRKRMYLPGKVLHLQHDVKHDGTHQYTAVWANTQDFQKIVISNKMISDHLAHTVVEAVDEIVRILTEEADEEEETRISIDHIEETEYQCSTECHKQAIASEMSSIASTENQESFGTVRVEANYPRSSETSL